MTQPSTTPDSRRDGVAPSRFNPSTTDPSPLARLVSSRVIRLIISPRLQRVRRQIREFARKLSGSPHRIDYYHQVDDPYSHLAVQALQELCARYSIELVPHVAAPDAGPNIPEPELLASLARRDCAAIAPHYGLAFPRQGSAPLAEAIADAERLLVAASREDAATFLERAIEVGEALWKGDSDALASLARDGPEISAEEARKSLGDARDLRNKQGHYSGAMFRHAGEWFWGVDRLHHLEHQLTCLGAHRGDSGICFERPRIVMNHVPRASEMTLELLPSLRSPYTAISFERVVELAERTGVRLVVRPVLPMVMRGVPATFAKGLYIMRDALREAACMKMRFGKFYDPIGEPVRRAYSLWPWARESGHGASLFASFLAAAFAEGINTGSDAGLQIVVERAGLSWQDALKRLGDPAWEAELEDNRLAMVNEMGQWGVPSFRLSGPPGHPQICHWGQDRLWLIAREIQRRGAHDGSIDQG